MIVFRGWPRWLADRGSADMKGLRHSERMRQEFLATISWAEGPAVRPAQGNALGDGGQQVHVSAQRANDSMNCWPVGPTTSLPVPPFPRALPWAGRTVLLRSSRSIARKSRHTLARNPLAVPPPK
jgi:hypothetical protein